MAYHFAPHPLEEIEEWLRRAGWTYEAEGWLPPPQFEEQIAQAVGRGHFRMSLAVMMQVEIYEQILRQIHREEE